MQYIKSLKYFFEINNINANLYDNKKFAKMKKLRSF